MKDLIFEPTQDLLDEHLREMVQQHEDYKLAYGKLKKLEYERGKDIDSIVNEKDKNGKKLYTYKTHAESHIDKENQERAKEIHNLTVERKRLESDYELMKMLYYHAKGKLIENRTLDVNASQEPF